MTIKLHNFCKWPTGARQAAERSDAYGFVEREGLAPAPAFAVEVLFGQALRAGNCGAAPPSRHAGEGEEMGARATPSRKPCPATTLSLRISARRGRALG